MGTLGPVAGVVVIAVFSALITWLAHSLRLRRARVQQHLDESWG